MLPTAEQKWRRIIERAAELHAEGAPLLIGTGSVAQSEMAGAELTKAGLAQEVLNAAQDADEADIVGRAGELGRITVVTSMAGRGTDIPLGPGAAEKGGLHATKPAASTTSSPAVPAARANRATSKPSSRSRTRCSPPTVLPF